MLGRDIVLQAFRDYGVGYLFGNPGTTELPLMDALVNYPEIQYILALHEDIAVGMAAGYAQASRQIGVVNLHVTPGLAHGLGNLYDAYRAGIPLVVTAGQHDSRLALQEPALTGNLVEIAKPFTKWSYEVRHAEELPLTLQRAFKLAQTEPCGPVFLSLPSNVMMQEVNRKPIPLTRLHQENTPSQHVIREVTKLLVKANNPVMLIGDRVGRTGAMSHAVQLAETLGCKVYGEHQSSALNFPYNHPQFFGRALPNGPYLQKIFRSADLLFLIGVTIQAPLLYFPDPIFSSNTKVIHVDEGDWEIGKNHSVDIGIVANISLTLSALNDQCRDVIHCVSNPATEDCLGAHIRTKVEARRAAVREDKAKYINALNEMLEKEWEHVPLSPIRVMAEVNHFLDERTFVVDESVTNGRYVHSYLDLTHENSLIALKGGGLGYGMPAALGAQLACPDKRVIATIGDGSALYYIQSLWNAAKYNLPVIYLILNNTSYMILKGGLQRMGGPAAKKGVFHGMDIVGPEVDFVSCAKAFGIDAVRVEMPSDIHPALQEAFRLPRPFLVDFVINRDIKEFLQ